MAHRRVCITFTKEEFKNLTELAEGRGKNLWDMMQADIMKSFQGLCVPDDKIIDKGKIVKTYDLPPTVWSSVTCVALHLGLTPGQLIYRVVVAPYLVQMVKKKGLVAEGISTD